MPQEAVPPSPSGPLDALAKVILPATICCYVTGFIIATPFFGKVGVPIYAVPTHAYLAAGLLFFAFSGASVLAGREVRAVFTATRGWKRLLSFALGLLVPLVVVTFLSPSLRALLYFLFMAVPVAAVRPGEIDPFRGSTLKRAWDWTRAGLIWISSAVLFSDLVYPVVPAQFGGGEAPIVFRGAGQEVRSGTPAEYWFKLECPGILPANPGCLTVRRIQETAEHMYLSIQHAPRACPDRPAHWRPWSWDEGICFARVSAKEVPDLFFPKQGW
jgi:hypothetical protein